MGCPVDFSHPSMKKRTGDEVEYEPYNMDRVSRHWMMWSIAAVAWSPAAQTMFWAERIFFLMPSAVAMILGAHKDSRLRRGIGG